MNPPGGVLTGSASPDANLLALTMTAVQKTDVPHSSAGTTTRTPTASLHKNAADARSIGRAEMSRVHLHLKPLDVASPFFIDVPSCDWRKNSRCVLLDLLPVSEWKVLKSSEPLLSVHKERANSAVSQFVPKQRSTRRSHFHLLSLSDTGETTKKGGVVVTCALDDVRCGQHPRDEHEDERSNQVPRILHVSFRSARVPVHQRHQHLRQHGGDMGLGADRISMETTSFLL